MRETVRKTGALNAALLFGMAGLALALIVTPFVANRNGGAVFARSAVPAFDNIVTGSIKKKDGTREYVVRRSILQEIPGAVCIINADGSSSGC